MGPYMLTTITLWFPPFEVAFFSLDADCGIMKRDDRKEVVAVKARLIKDKENRIALLLADGSSVVAPSVSVLSSLLFNFKSVEDFGFDRGPENWNGEYPDMLMVPGQNLAYVTDSLQLVVEDVSPFLAVFEQVKTTVPIEDVLTAAEYAKKHNKSVEQVKVFCRNGRIWGAKKIGRDWVIPADAPYPADTRMGIGKLS